MSTILGIDPGTTQSGYVLLFDNEVTGSGVVQNGEVLALLQAWGRIPGTTLAIEMIASYGMPVGREVFETCVWIGRFKQAWAEPDAVRLVYRKDVKLHLCGAPRAKDPNVRQALIDLFPASGGGKTPQIGTKGQPGPLYGVSSHAWPALGVAVTALAQMNGQVGSRKPQEGHQNAPGSISGEGPLGSCGLETKEAWGGLESQVPF